MNANQDTGLLPIWLPLIVHIRIVFAWEKVKYDLGPLLRLRSFFHCYTRRFLAQLLEPIVAKISTDRHVLAHKVFLAHAEVWRTPSNVTLTGVPSILLSFTILNTRQYWWKNILIYIPESWLQSPHWSYFKYWLFLKIYKGFKLLWSRVPVVVKFSRNFC